jgi:hypothetical protein
VNALRLAPSLGLAALALTATLGFTRGARAEDTEVEKRYPPSSARVGVIVTGAGMTAAAYGGAAGMAGAWSDAPGTDMLFIPVAGPWIGLGKLGCGPDEESSPGQGDCTGMLALRGILYVLDGLVQLGGLGVVAEGMFMTTEAAGDAPAKAALAPTFMLAPIVSEHQVGLGIGGTF